MPAPVTLTTALPAGASIEVGTAASPLFVSSVTAGGASTNPAETTSTPAAVTLVASTAKALLAANTSRIRATIINPLATPLYVRKALLATSAATAAAGGYDIIVPANGGSWISDPYEYAGAFNGICATAGDVGVSETV